MYVIVYKRNGKRVRKDGKVTPAFQYPAQVWRYIYKELNDSTAVKPYLVHGGRWKT